MREIRTETVIDAEPAEVWEKLTDLDSWSQWNPFITEASGLPEEGEKLNMRFRPPGGMSMRMKPKVIRSQTARELRWLGHLGVPGIFDGEHYFQLQPGPDGGTRLVQGEKFTGFTVPLFGSVLSKSEKGFEMLNEALREECEKPD